MMSKRKYVPLEDGDGLSLENGEVFFLSCCDCGLVHKMAVVSQKRGKEIGLALMRDKRRTAQLRRHREFLKK